MLGDNAMQQTVENAIEGKVAKILNSRELAINRGAGRWRAAGHEI